MKHVESSQPAGLDTPEQRNSLESACANYAWMVRHGAVPRAKVSLDKHLDRYEEAQEHNHEINQAVRTLLLTLGIGGRMRFWYYAFARRLDRLCRLYSKKTLEMAAVNLVDYWEFKGLDPEVLDAIALCIFGLALPKPVSSRPDDRQSPGRVRVLQASVLAQMRSRALTCEFTRYLSRAALLRSAGSPFL